MAVARPASAPEARPGAPAGREAARYRMKDLCALTGLERQTIHFYIQEGLVPEGHKVGRNMAFYGEAHLERLRLVKKLQQERFLPLRAIRAVLGGKEGSFSEEQRSLLAEVKRRLAGDPGGRPLVRAGRGEHVDVRSLAERAGVPTADVEEMIDLGLLAAEGGPKARRVRLEDAWLVEAWGELVRAGFSRERGFSPRDLALIDEAVTDLFAKERDLFLERFGQRSAEEIAATLTRALPILSRLFAGLHEQKARDTFELALEGDDLPRRERSRS